ncbi:hypothetical protein [Erythrobacter sp. SD-21]|uniref:hypothetical protein n=1 Tax=Erythrobacter sp. SD-21 TaxID=161528 RepID=UPI000153F0C8|nr:hypothetical protein [Erythrobacter sp. SD-21]EDL48254.1 hypothetical protein ED21_31924 [Erythrobacter sp. SD-21]
MSKSSGSLADQLQSLGVAKQKAPKQPVKNKSKKPVSNFRSKAAREPGVADPESQIRQKLADANAQSEDAEQTKTREIKPAKRDAPHVIIETRKRLPSRAVDPSRKPSKPVQPVKQPKGQLTQSAARRLHYEPKPPVKEVHEAAAKPALAPTHKPAPAPEPSRREIPGETRPFTAAEAFAHITRIVGASTPAIEERPTRIQSKEARRLDEAVRSGAEWLRDNPEPDFDNGFVVGFDFGTSSLKVVVRDPYVAGNPLAALPAPVELRSQGHPYLWQTVVWFDPAVEIFRLYPTPGAITLDGFKTGIIAGNGSEAIFDEPKISRSEGATAFIALHLCHLLGWYAKEQPLERSKAKNFLAINIGVPVATSDNPAALQPFKEVVRAAVELARSCEPLTLEMVRAALEMVHAEDLPDGFDLIPELSAALVGYASDPTSPLGSHVLVDVGASTLDMVAFNLVEDEDEAEIKAFSATVELLGSSALEVAQNKGVLKSDFLKACNHQFGNTFAQACRLAPLNFSLAKNPNRKDVYLVVTGGGSNSILHKEFFARLRDPHRALGPGRIDQPAPPSEIIALDCDRTRLLLAFGLAHDIPDIVSTTNPSRIPRLQTKQATGPEYVGAEQT